MDFSRVLYLISNFYSSCFVSDLCGSVVIL
uniref:Uncharacterized protein n=1 Tax=Medicago truncatula TaxID=3880 RepID=B7FHU8_MEDTR|nr:unknown [Medicago truncatula]